MAQQVDVLIWQAQDTPADSGTVPVGRGSLQAILRLAELGLAHADQVTVTEAKQAIEQIRAILAAGTK